MVVDQSDGGGSSGGEVPPDVYYQGYSGVASPYTKIQAYMIGAIRGVGGATHAGTGFGGQAPYGGEDTLYNTVGAQTTNDLNKAYDYDQITAIANQNGTYSLMEGHPDAAWVTHPATGYRRSIVGGGGGQGQTDFGYGANSPGAVGFSTNSDATQQNSRQTNFATGASQHTMGTGTWINNGNGTSTMVPSTASPSMPPGEAEARRPNCGCVIGPSPGYRSSIYDTNSGSGSGYGNQWYNNDASDWYNPLACIGAYGAGLGDRMGGGFGTAFIKDQSLTAQMYQNQRQQQYTQSMADFAADPGNANIGSVRFGNTAITAQEIGENLQDAGSIADGVLATAELGMAVKSAVDLGASALSAAAGRASAEEAAAATCGRLKTCFPAGTLVATNAGLVPIQDIRVSEQVWGFDLVAREWKLRHVLETYAGEYKGTLYAITVAGETIEASCTHPFWVVKGRDLQERPKRDFLPEAPSGTAICGRWVDACELRVGDILLLKPDKQVPVAEVTARDVRITVYNFHVDELECYAVGRRQVLVHNDCGTPTRPDLYRTGNTKGPSPIRVGKDIVPDAAGNVMPTVPPTGLSTFDNPGAGGTTGILWRLPGDAPLPAGLTAIPDSPPPGHYSIGPTHLMSLPDFLEALGRLPWVNTGVRLK